MPAMTHEELEEFLRRPLVVAFTTIRGDGSPHVSPIWFEYDEGKFYCWVDAGSVKARNIRKNPSVALCIATHDEPHKYVLVEGHCEIVREGVAERAYSISTRYYGAERGTEFARETMASGSSAIESGNSVLLVTTPTRLITESSA